MPTTLRGAARASLAAALLLAACTKNMPQPSGEPSSEALRTQSTAATAATTSATNGVMLLSLIHI